MSDHFARSAISRMNLRELLISAHYEALAADIRMLAAVDQSAMELETHRRQDELMSAYGFTPVSNAERKPFAFANGVAVIPVHGVLINRFGYSWGFVTGYNFIRQQTALAGQDPDVKAIVYDHNSPGGEAAGCFELANDIPKLSAGKPTMAMIDSNCYSGSYALATAAKKIVCTPSGGAGSVGVVTLHVSYEKMISDAGLKLTFIFAGDHKVDGNSYQDLSKEVQADIQASIDKTYDAFVAVVAKGRKGKMDDKAVRATEARVYRADAAKAEGLIDAVASPQAAMQAFMGELTGSNSQLPQEDAMSDGTTGAAKATQQELNDAKAEAAKAERTRVAGITGCEEAKGRESMANHIAMNTDMTVDQAKAMLAAAPKATAAVVPGAAFEKAMTTTGNPKVGADTGAEGETVAGAEPTSEQKVVGLLANAKQFGIRGFGDKPEKLHH